MIFYFTRRYFSEILPGGTLLGHIRYFTSDILTSLGAISLGDSPLLRELSPRSEISSREYSEILYSLGHIHSDISRICYSTEVSFYLLEILFEDIILLEKCFLPRKYLPRRYFTSELFSGINLLRTFVERSL